tara:strand:- start:559 stop:3645 length:3087 start_codon:yes stop_codon:yes gene_type:complete
MSIIHDIIESDQTNKLNDLHVFLKEQSSIVSYCNTHILSIIQNELNDTNKKRILQRISALAIIETIYVNFPIECTSFSINILPCILKAYSDKDKLVREKAEAVGNKIISNISVYDVRAIIPKLLDSMDNSCREYTVIGSLKMLSHLAENAPIQITHCLTSIIPILSDCMTHISTQVKEQAVTTMRKVCITIDNKDIINVIPKIIDAISDISLVPETIHDLASCTFVQTVDSATLSITVPLLSRGLKEKSASIKRQCAKICANMSKLVEQPTEVESFLPALMPGLDKARHEVSDPEARSVCEQAYSHFKNIENNIQKSTFKKLTEDIIKQWIVDNGVEYDELSIQYVSLVILCMCESNILDLKIWQQFIDTQQLTCNIKNVLDNCVLELSKGVVQEEEEEDVEELCNCTFTLAYGSKILLHNTNMKLLRGYRYGLLGGNDSGKTTLMRAIANEQVEGFPPGSELRTVFVEADILGELSDLSCIDYIFADERIKNAKIPKDDIENMLHTVGFSKKMVSEPVTFLSGGWRMKLALARAMLQKADILLMDEPTNHLDVINVQWTIDYINSLKNVTSIIVSHDSKLLDKCCTHILEIKNLKLFTTKGNLSCFVSNNPDAKAYFELKSNKLKFNFPQPGFIQGIKSKGKPLIKMSQCEYTYPVNDKPTITDITVQVSLSSRVACVGVNGAGKSTMIKMLTGETIPTKGTVWKHPNARVAYVAQHAFHHIEKHLNKTPNEYIRWRFEHGEDKEAIQKETMTLTDEEQTICNQPVTIDSLDDKGNTVKIKRVIDRLTGARKEDKKLKELLYEVAWVGMGYEYNTYLSQEKLEKLGFKKHCKMVDEKITMREGAYKRPLTQVNVEKHLEDVGLDREFGSHHRMSALSGGQKVKVVLAASLWNQPHIIILDEPTNYLDRESLGALATAIEEYEGGVVMITHNNDFCSKLCPETWVLEKKEDGIGHLDCKGDAEWMTNVASEKVEFKAMEEMVDSLGNVVKVKQAKKVLSRQEKKKKAKIRAARIARGEAVSSDDEDWE